MKSQDQNPTAFNFNIRKFCLQVAVAYKLNETSHPYVRIYKEGEGSKNKYYHWEHDFLGYGGLINDVLFLGSKATVKNKKRRNKTIVSF